MKQVRIRRPRSWQIDAVGHGCQDMRCTLPHAHAATQERPGPPGILRPRMHRTRPVRVQLGQHGVVR